MFLLISEAKMQNDILPPPYSDDLPPAYSPSSRPDKKKKKKNKKQTRKPQVEENNQNLVPAAPNICTFPQDVMPSIQEIAFRVLKEYMQEMKKHTQ